MIQTDYIFPQTMMDKQKKKIKEREREREKENGRWATSFPQNLLLAASLV